MTDDTQLSIISKSPEETEAIGKLLGSMLNDGIVVCLSGELGAGKTCLTRGIAKGWGTVEQPTSPTFTLINEYRSRLRASTMFHMDCYRLSGAIEAQTTALDDVLDSAGIVIIEWPERIMKALPDQNIWISITDRGSQTRELIFKAAGKNEARIVEELRRTTSDKN